MMEEEKFTKNAELSYEKHEFLKKKCSDNSIEFLSSAFSVDDAELLKTLNCESIKIPSFEVNNIELLQFCKKTSKESSFLQVQQLKKK